MGHFVIPARAKGTRGVQTSGPLPESTLMEVGARVTVPQNFPDAVLQVPPSR